MTSGHTITTEPARERVRVVHAGTTVAESTRALVLYETGLPARYYLPREDVRLDLLEPTDFSTTCPFKGEASYWSLRIGDEHRTGVAWSYEHPLDERTDIAGMICFYPEKVDEHTVDGVPAV